MAFALFFCSVLVGPLLVQLFLWTDSQINIFCCQGVYTHSLLSQCKAEVECLRGSRSAGFKALYAALEAFDIRLHGCRR